MEEFKVIGSLEVAGKVPGELVELDPNEVNIQALIDGGHVEPAAIRVLNERES